MGPGEKKTARYLKEPRTPQSLQGERPGFIGGLVLFSNQSGGISSELHATRSDI